MSEKDQSLIYDGPPIWAKMAAWVMLGIGVIVLTPIMLVRGDHWLLLLIVPLVLVGLILLSLRLRIAVVSSTSVLRVTNSVLSLVVRQRQYLRDDILGLDIDRVAGDERERDSDTWYLRLRLRNRGYTIGRYDSRISALMARRNIDEALQSIPLAVTKARGGAADESRDARRRQIAHHHYMTGIALLRAGNRDDARAAFEKALSFAEEPLLRRMSRQRLQELERR